MRQKLISIQTTRYSEFFRHLFQEYGTNSVVAIDGKIFKGQDFDQLAKDWCTNEKISQTRNFTLSRGGVDLFGFHDSPDELWAVNTELPFVERMAQIKLISFK